MLIFLLILSILILVHELGHFVTAKRMGIKVEKFSLGFGPKLVSKKIGETEYLLCAIPFGGYIKMAGDSAEEFQGAKDEFLSRSPGERSRIIFAGPLFNYFLAFVCMWLVFYLGFPRVTTTIGDLVPDMPAEAAGLMAGDKVFEINGAKVEFWDELSKKIHTSTAPVLHLKVVRDHRTLEIDVTTQKKEVETLFGKKKQVPLIGIHPSAEFVKVRYGILTALVKGTQNLLQMTWMTIVSIFYIIIGTISFRESVTGPLGIFFIATNAAKVGFSAVLHVIGILSMSLAVFNLLPLPILDGGHIALAGLEKLRGKTLSRRTEETINNVGLSFLIMLAIFIFCNDFVRYGYWDKLMAFFGR